MSNKKLLLLLYLFLLIVINGYAQDKWDLKRCVDYAVANNISVKQADVQARLSKLTLTQSQWSQIPTLLFGAGLGLNSGNTLNPTSYSLNTSTALYNNYSLQSNVTLFNGFYLRHLI